MRLKAVAVASTLATMISPALQAATATGNLTVRITINQECAVSSGLPNSLGSAVLDFGAQGALTSPVDAQTPATGDGAIRVQCTAGTAYNIGLNAGSNPATPGDITTRRMANGSNYVSYQLYLDAGRTSVWGSTVGTNTVSGTADGTVQNYQVFGRVPAQTTPPAGGYTDVVTINVTF